MPTLGMEGTYRLTQEMIDERIIKICPGNNAVGRKDESGKFLVSVIGRSDLDLKSALKSWIGRTNKALFKFRYATSARDAFGIECENYHDFIQKRKGKHPARPDGANWRCPRCDFYK